MPGQTTSLVDRERFPWNEHYLLQALLCHSTTFEVLLPCWALHRVADDAFRHAFARYNLNFGSSWWMRRTPPPGRA